MKWIRQRVISGEIVAGTWCNLGSSVSAKMAGQAGFDWLLIDLEHGVGDHESLIYQLQAVESTPAAPIVRIAWNEASRFKRVLDLGASGIMVPYVNNAAEAKLAVSSMCYPPLGIRGVAKTCLVTEFGQYFEEYYSKANDNLLTVVQIETKAAVDSADEIAAVSGVDVLFVGPVDLSASLGVLMEFDNPEFRGAKARVVAACRNAGKAAGIICFGPDKIEDAISEGFTFIGVGSDGGLVAGGMKKIVTAFEKYKRR